LARLVHENGKHEAYQAVPAWNSNWKWQYFSADE